MRPSVTIAATALLLMTLQGLPLGGHAMARAQGTPTAPAATPSAAPGRTLLLQAVLDEAPEAPAVIRLSRVTVDPSPESIEIGGEPPTFTVMESGTVSAAVSGPAVLLGAGGDEANGRSIPLVGEPFTFAAGDRLALAAETAASLENLGDGPATLLVATIEAGGATGRESTPEAATPVADGQITTMQPLGEGRIETLPRGPVAVTLERFSLVSGLGMPPYPGPVLVAVESGGFASTLDAGEVQVWRGAAAGSPPEIAAGGSFTLTAGEALFSPNGMEASPPLAGEGALILLRLGILPLPEATPEAGQEGASFPVGGIVVVTRDDVRLRSGPSTAEAVVAGLAAGQTLIVTGPPIEGEGRLWYPVRDPVAPALVGYVAAEFLAAAG
jgi:hypothetical protein